MKRLNTNDKAALACEFGLSLAAVETIVAVESGGKGFDDATGKIIIQFEPAWFKRKAPYTPSGKWSLNKVERQAKEWEAFNDAFMKNPEAAMESTSVGLMQVMGFHHKLLGFTSVGALWDFARESEANQVRLGLKFIKLNKKMYAAAKDFSNITNCRTFAYYYNGEKYELYNYHIKLYNTYQEFI
jgi:hypothetical protein